MVDGNKIDQKSSYIRTSEKANVVEHGKGLNLGANGGTFKKKFLGNCHNCDQRGYWATNCKLPKKAKEENVMEKITKDVSDIDLAVLILWSPIQRSGGLIRELPVMFARIEWFRNIKVVDNDDKLFMGNSTTSDIQGVGKIVLKMTSRRELKLNDVLYVPEIRKNLVSGWLLNKHGFRLVFESDKFVLTKNYVHVSKGYAERGMFKLCVMALKPSDNDNEMNKSSTYLLES
uniref:Retrovirus-related Pol polyprotein from transposon TNT 1-94-like beta-barrel domain-containing protein n=1 Tax=Lactuca sativa TaxID=4236 RepID=A0A9R1VFW3_LACSA|nr:hypothetical protein LSAT_V11C500267090 [Lactuca sativa]